MILPMPVSAFRSGTQDLMDCIGQTIRHWMPKAWIFKYTKIFVYGRLSPGGFGFWPFEKSLTAPSTTLPKAKPSTKIIAPLREMSREVVIGSMTFMVAIRPPESDDITLTWMSNTEVVIGALIAPWNCPKKIKIMLGLDLSRGVAE